MTLEIELGCTGGEEDGVDNSDMDASELYTSPEDVAYAYENSDNSSRRQLALIVSLLRLLSVTCMVFTNQVMSY